MPVPLIPCGCIETTKGARAATLQRIASALCGNSSNPLQPEPPTYAAAFVQAWNPDGGPGEIAAFAISPGGFAPLSTRESGPRAPTSVLKPNIKPPALPHSRMISAFFIAKTLQNPIILQENPLYTAKKLAKNSDNMYNVEC